MFKPTLRQIEYFQKLAEHLSFQKAAESCYVTQSTLSNAIKDLELGLKLKLFHRTKRHVSLTDAGQALLADTKSLLAAQDGFLLHAEELASTKKISVRLGIIPTIAPFILPRLFDEVRAMSDAVELQITENLTHVLYEKLENKLLDAALIALPYPTPKSFQSFPVCDDPFVLACGVESSKTLPEKLTITELDNLPLLFLEDGHCLSDQTISACKLKQNAREDKRYKGMTLQTMMELVAKNNGFALVPESLKTSYSHRADLVFKGFADSQPHRKITLVCAAKLSDSKQHFFESLPQKITFS